jgi:hypothetical protein
MDEYTIERMPLPVEELKVIADLTVRLVQLRQNECKHLCIENIGPEIWRNLLMATYPPPMMHVSGEPFRPGAVGPIDWQPTPDSAPEQP